MRVISEASITKVLIHVEDNTFDDVVLKIVSASITKKVVSLDKYDIGYYGFSCLFYILPQLF